MLVRLLEQFDAGQFDALASELQRTLYNHFRGIGQFHKVLVTRSHLDEYREEADARALCQAKESGRNRVRTLRAPRKGVPGPRALGG